MGMVLDNGATLLGKTPPDWFRKQCDGCSFPLPTKLKQRMNALLDGRMRIVGEHHDWAYRLIRDDLKIDQLRSRDAEIHAQGARYVADRQFERNMRLAARGERWLIRWAVWVFAWICYRRLRHWGWLVGIKHGANCQEILVSPLAEKEINTCDPS